MYVFVYYTCILMDSGCAVCASFGFRLLSAHSSKSIKYSWICQHSGPSYCPPWERCACFTSLSSCVADRWQWWLVQSGCRQHCIMRWSLWCHLSVSLWGSVEFKNKLKTCDTGSMKTWIRGYMSKISITIFFRNITISLRLFFMLALLFLQVTVQQPYRYAYRRCVSLIIRCSHWLLSLPGGKWEY